MENPEKAPVHICSSCGKPVINVYQLGKCKACLEPELDRARQTIDKNRKPKSGD